MITTGAQLAEWRDQAGLTQVEAARALGYAPRQYQRLEAGERIPRRVALAVAGYESLRRDA